MERLLDLADALVVSAPDQQPDPPDFEIPEEYSSVPTDRLLQLRESTMGKGWYAAKDIAAGTLLMVSKPMGMVMDWEDDSGEVEEGTAEDAMESDDDDDVRGTPPDDETEGRMNELLYLEILRKLKDQPSLWPNCLTHLFPRDEADLSSVPAVWVNTDDEIFVEVENAITQLQQVPELQLCTSEIVRRLPLIIRYNVLSVETCSELLSYPGPKGHSSLSGVALHYLPSFFNHSCRPNVNRWSIGDVMFFVANQEIKAGSEVCISYIESDVLCESADRRNRMLNMDFSVADDDIASSGSRPVQKPDEGPEIPVVDSDVQNELMAMDPLGRMQAIDELMQQALGLKVPEGEEGESPIDGDSNLPSSQEEPAGWFQCDVHNLRILQAITLDGVGKTDEALKLWEESVAFADSKLPPLDENSVVLRVQAALCAHHKGDIDRAKHHAQVALQSHHLLFGGGVNRFRRRFRHDLELKLRPEVNSQAAVDFLWPVVQP